MLKKWVVLSIMLLAPVAFAEEEGGFSSGGGSGKFDVLGGFAYAAGQSAFQIGIGDPGLEAKYTYGLTSAFNLGGLLALNWGEWADFVLRFQVPLRYAFYNSGNLGLAVGFTPGIAILFAGGGAGVGVNIPLPIDFSTSYRVSHNLSILAAFEIPLEIMTKGGANALIPIAVATGLEYYLSPKVKLWSRLRIGHGFLAKGAQQQGPGGMSSEGGGGGSIGGYINGHVGAAFLF